MSPADAYEEVQAVAAIQGIVNRDAATLYVRYMPIDDHWLRHCLAHWLGPVTLTNITSIESLVQQFQPALTGAVLYDPAVASTSNVANTAAGVLDAVPICARNATGTLYERLVLGGPRLKVVENLVGKFTGAVSGSAKCDAYLWAIKEYIETGKSNPAVLAYYIDYFWVQVASNGNSYTVNTVSNHDYFVSKRAFFWDLSPWGDQAPNDDPKQPLGTDLKTLQAMMLAMYKRTNGTSMIMIGGFVPWLFKYVNKVHPGVATEWQLCDILSAYNAYISADACCVDGMANAALWTHYPLAERYVQNRAPTPESLEAAGFYNTTTGEVATKTYYAFYAGDYDSAAWLYNKFWGNWNDTARGTVPIGWAVDPNLQARFPIMFDVLMRSLTATDRITTGDSGAGYLNPTQLFEPRQHSGLPSAAATWVAHSKPLYQQFGMTFTGFVINGAAGHMTAEAQSMYTPFSWDGMTDQTGYAPSKTMPYLQGNTPVFEETDLPGGNPTPAAQVITGQFRQGKLQFQVFRTILQSATFHAEVAKQVSAAHADNVVVEPLVLSYLARAALGGNNDDRVAYIADTVPRAVVAGAPPVAVTVTVRNNGWNVLTVAPSAGEARGRSPHARAGSAAAEGGTAGIQLRYTLTSAGGAVLTSGMAAAAADVAVGTDGVFRAQFSVPATAPPGAATLSYGLERGPAAPLSAVGNPDYVCTVVVAPAAGPAVDSEST